MLDKTGTNSKQTSGFMVVWKKYWRGRGKLNWNN